MAVGIKDLAEKLNLSITTVSRALDGYSDVSEETRQRVIEAARELGYVPDYNARQLRRKRTDSIGYILPTSSPEFSNPFYTNFLTGLCDESASQHMDLVVTSCAPDSEDEHNQYRRWGQSHRVDGLVINRTRVHDWRLDFLEHQHIPFVTLVQSETAPLYPGVIMQDRAGMKKLVAHLAQNGHRRIAYAGVSDNLILQVERFGGYRDGLSDAGLPLDASLTEKTELTESSGYQAGLILLQHANPPTAMIGCNDQVALGLLRASKELGYQVGSQIAISGYNGIKELEHTDPPLTTLYQPTYQIARILADMLIRMVAQKPLDAQQVWVEPTLVVRASTRFTLAAA